MNNDTQTPSSRLFYEIPNCLARFLRLIFSGRIYFTYAFLVQATLLLATKIKQRGIMGFPLNRVLERINFEVITA